jgi:DUF4097 and DUF4098 domain-containing protein YvlB
MRKGFVTVLFVALVASAACHAADRDFERTVPAESKGSVRISNVAGKVTVMGWDRSEVQVKAHLTGDVERVDVITDKGRTTIKVVMPRSSFRDGEADLDIRVPEQSDVDVSAVSADVETTRLTGPQRLTTVSGDVRAEFAKDFEGKSVSGDMRLKGTSQVGDVRVSSVSGDIYLDRAAGELDATSVSGDLMLDVGSASSIRTRTTSGDLTLRGSMLQDGSIEAETISGDVTVRVKPKAGFEYEASSFTGDIGNCFGKHSEATNAHGPGSRLMGTVGEGRGRVRVKSMSGDVAICDR